MVRTDSQHINVDELRFAGRRKYNRGRLFAVNGPPRPEDEVAGVRNNSINGKEVDALWDFGLRQCCDCRHFVLE
jgi:hypothetical protein